MNNGQDQPPPTTPAAPVLTPSEALQMRVRVAERAHDTEAEFGASANAAAVKNAEEAIKTAILINGGSSVAMLAFIGTLVSRDVLSPEQITNITKPLLYFGYGIASAMVASAAAYFTNLFIAGSSNRRQREYEHPFVRTTPSSLRNSRLGEVCRWAAVLAMVVSMGCFIGGLIVAKAHSRNWPPRDRPQPRPPNSRSSCRRPASTEATTSARIRS